MPDRETETRQCPFCKEEVKAAAVRCKHCLAAIQPTKPDHEGVCVPSVRKRSMSRPLGAGIARPISRRVGDDCVVCLDVRCLLRPHSSHEGYGREGLGHARLSVQDRPMKGVPTSISMTREHGVSWSPASTTAFTSCVNPLPSVLTPSSSRRAAGLAVVGVDDQDELAGRREHGYSDAARPLRPARPRSAGSAGPAAACTRFCPVQPAATVSFHSLAVLLPHDAGCDWHRWIELMFRNPGAGVIRDLVGS